MAPFLVSFNKVPIFGFGKSLWSDDHILSKAALLSSYFLTKVKLYFLALESCAMLFKKVTKLN